METILVATDFSTAAKNATAYAASLANFFGAKLILVNAYPTPSANLDTMFPTETFISTQVIALKNLEMLKYELLSNNKGYVNITCEAEMGSIYDVINLISKKYDVDLIVTGITEEAGLIKEHLIGSSVVKIAREIEIPTFIIPEKTKYKPIKHISFACDMQKTEQTKAISIVKYFSEVFNAELEIINIEKPEEEVSYEKARTSVFIEKKLESIKHHTVYITEEKIVRGLEDYLEYHPTDLVIINPKKHNIFHTLFKENVTNELAFHLHVPILAIH